jgi:succinate-acetate transporter protein
VYIWFGGMVQIFGAVGEWILGNTFSCALFFTYGTRARLATRLMY